MLIDLADSSAPDHIDCDLCIVGAGAAGITLALQLAATKLDVVVLESGAFEPDPAVQALNAGTFEGANRLPVDSTRLRFFGGTTNHWTGLIAPFAAEDFDNNSGGVTAPWPVTSAQMLPLYRRALDVVQHPLAHFDSSLAGKLGRCDFPLDADRISQSYLHYSGAIRFGETYRSTLVNAAGVRVVLNATVTRLEADARGDAIKYVVARAGVHADTRVSARCFVLACGAIENARILLQYQREQASTPLDPSRLAGRYLADHPTAFCGRVISTGQPALANVFADFDAAGHRFRPVLSLPSALRAAQGIPNASCYLWRSQAPDGLRGYLARAKAQILDTPAHRDRLLAQAASAIDQSTSGAERDCANGAQERAAPLLIKAVLEQAPDAANRVTLGAQTDRLGISLPHLAWRLGDAEHRALRALLINLGTELGRLGAGRVQMAPWLEAGAAGLNANMQDYNHPMSCTRMAHRSQDGVVDPNLRVFGSRNLYIAGASVFPAGGIYNPTLTIVALAVRLADHLASQLLAT